MLENLEFPEKLTEVFYPTKYYRNIVLRGGRGSAKSWSIARKFITEATYTKNRYLCCRETMKSIEASVYQLLVDQIKILGADGQFVAYKKKIFSLAGSEFIFEGLKQNISKVRSMEGVTRCWAAEAEKISQESWDVLIPTVRAPGSQFYIDYNPGSKKDATDVMFFQNPPPNTLNITMNYMDNPWLPVESRRDMEYCKRIDYEKYQHIWLGLYKEYANALIFRGKFRVEEFETPGDARFYFGLDFGFSVSPTALVRCFIKDRKLYIDYEAYGHGIENNDLHQFVATVPGSDKWPILADCARPETISFLAHPFDSKGVHYDGYRVTPCEKGKGSVEDGIQFLRGFEEIIIHPRCKGTAEDYDNYKWKVDRNTNEILPVPADGSDDSCDATRYALEKLMKKKVTLFDLA